MNQANTNERAGQRQLLVYHGKALGGGRPLGPAGFYVTADRGLAETFGDVHRVYVPAGRLLPDPEQEGFAGRALTGVESLRAGSAIAPPGYYGFLSEVGEY